MHNNSIVIASPAQFKEIFARLRGVQMIKFDGKRTQVGLYFNFHLLRV